MTIVGAKQYIKEITLRRCYWPKYEVRRATGRLLWRNQSLN